MKVAASPQIYMGRCPKVVCKSLVMYTALKGFRVQGSGFRGVVRRIKTGKRRGVLKYMVFTKDGKPVNLQNLLTYEDSHKG